VHLRTLRIRGFKSFPDPVEISLEPGVAVVVGPNGSGKSNVADGIVWAAGSLAPSELRAEKPDDVLFAGGGDRAAAEHCEVELVFDNEDGGLAELDFSEVSIARRLVRGGEGQYLVNRTPVRRTDLVELLADVGLGGSMHSIVGQGKVEAVLASKPEDRRELLEEAAGLGKFKRRRHRAELKLSRVALQVERARDVEREVRKRLRPLALQATAAERAAKLGREISGLRARVAELDLARIADLQDVAAERRDAAAIAKRGANERLQALLEERSRAEDELSDAAGRREAALASRYRLQGAAERLAVRRESLGSFETRLVEELAEAQRAAAAPLDGAAAALEQEARQAAAAARDTSQESGRAAERARIAHATLAAACRERVGIGEQRLDALRAERAQLESELAATATGGDAASRTLLVLGGARERLEQRHEAATSLSAEVAAELASARALAASGRPAPAQLEEEANEAAAHARLAARERDELAERARAARERLAALDAALAEREGLPPAARALAAEGERLAVGLVQAEPGDERAAAAALGWRASAVLTDDVRRALALLEQARDAGHGSLAVLVGADPASLVAALPVVPLDQLLDTRVPAVTREGFGYDPDRGELWFAGETAEAILLEMQARRNGLADEAEELAARAEAAERTAADAGARAEASEAAYAEVAHLRVSPLDPALLERLASSAETLALATARAADLAGRLARPLDHGIAARSARSAELGAQLARLATAEATTRGETAAAAARAQEAEVVVARLGGEVGNTAARGDVELLAEEAKAALAGAELAAAAARTAADRAVATEAALLARAPRRPRLDEDLLRRLSTAVGALARGLDAAAELATRLDAPVRARVDAGGHRTSALAEELRRLGAAEVEMRDAAEVAAQHATTVEVELVRLDADADEARRRLAAAGEVEPAQGDDRDELAARIERLEARRAGLGQVNPLAQEEYEAETARLEELARQRADLEASLEEIEKLRDELADTVERRFADTFSAVAEHFADVAATLFPGGEGRLRLVEPVEDSGELGVEVELRPAGKRITRLSLLSGGEKALAAISFLFALFLARPCPFYLLDEVEAALDDTNITRFVELLRRYADRAQFVVITHQKRTMEAADVLYGVTMGADGVSRVVSRRLPASQVGDGSRRAEPGSAAA
jgi:chromosome segregation protein